MPSKGHKISGLLATVFPLSACFLYEMPLFAYLFAFMGVVMGVNAPDYLEIRYNKKTIKKERFKKDRVINASHTVLNHRGITHTLTLWIGFCVYLFLNLFDKSVLGDYVITTSASDELVIVLSCLAFSYANGIDSSSRRYTK